MELATSNTECLEGLCSYAEETGGASGTNCEIEVAHTRDVAYNKVDTKTWWNLVLGFGTVSLIVSDTEG